MTDGRVARFDYEVVLTGTNITSPLKKIYTASGSRRAMWHTAVGAWTRDDFRRSAVCGPQIRNLSISAGGHQVAQPSAAAFAWRQMEQMTDPAARKAAIRRVFSIASGSRVAAGRVYYYLLPAADRELAWSSEARRHRNRVLTELPQPGDNHATSFSVTIPHLPAACPASPSSVL